MDDNKNIIPLKTRRTLEKSLERMSIVEHSGQSILQKLPSNINIAQLLAKLETEKSITKLAHLRDHAEREELQRQCANDLLNRAWGMPAQSVQVTTENKTALDPIVIEATDILIEAQAYLSRPISEWPEKIREYFSVTDDEEEEVS